jgi:quercetin dioxygenase-like cupin family protein
MNKIKKRPEGVGTKLFKIIACSVFLVFSVFQSHQAFATEGVPAVTISVNDQGETIILADGEILAISAGDGWQTFELSSGVTIKAFIDPDTGKVTVCVVTGTVEVTSGGQTVTVQEGECTTASPGEAPTTPAPTPPPPAPPELPDAPTDTPHSPSS